MPTTTEPQAVTPLDSGDEQSPSPTAPHPEISAGGDPDDVVDVADLDDLDELLAAPDTTPPILPDPTPLAPHRPPSRHRAEIDAAAEERRFTVPQGNAGPHRAPRTDPSPAPDPYIGAVIADRYRIESKVGEGGMGAVYLAVHRIIERKVAIKILSEDFARKPDLVQRFMQEARAAARIGHENIVEVYDFGETESRSVFFAMEFLEGQDLAQVIRTQAPLPAARVRHIAAQICKALGAAHGKQIIHRDMKPENVFLVEREGRSDFVKVLDFGIAKFSNIEEAKSRLTRTGMIFGTPEYMSPEQARGDAPDHRVDIYALGCILYEMLTGTVPFSADTFMGVLTKHMFEPVEPPSRRGRLPIPPELEQVVLRALEKDRDRRFQSMQELAVALESETLLAPGPPGGAVLAPMGLAASQRYPSNPAQAPAPLQSGEVAAALGAAPAPSPYPSGATSGIGVPAGVPMPGVVYPGAMVAPYLPHAGDRTAQSSLPARRRKTAVLAGAVGGGVVLALLVWRGGGQPQQPLVSTSGPVLQAPETPLPVAAPKVEPSIPRQPAAPRGPGKATLLISGTVGARVELRGEDRGEIPQKDKQPLRIEIELKDGADLRALLSVRKRDFIDDSREMVLQDGREAAMEVTLQPKPRRRPGSKERDKDPPRLEEQPKPAAQPLDKSLRNPFLRADPAKK